MCGLFRFIFEEKKCDPNQVIKVKDHADIAKCSFNEINKNMYVNTFLHTLIVNEHRFASGNSLAEYVLELPFIKEKFDFNKKDKIIKESEGKEKDGKTILCLAAKMREAVIVKKLCKLKKEGCNIDLDLLDEHGRTALFYSYALGDSESTKALLEAGANPNLVDQASIDYFRNNRTDVANILKSVAINPERDEEAKSNNFVHPDDHKPNLDDFYKINKGNEKNIIAYINLIKDKPTEEQLSLKKESEEAYDELIQFTRTQILDSEGKSFLTGKSLLDSCLEGQAECFGMIKLKKHEQSLLENNYKFPLSPPGSVLSPEGKTIVPSNTTVRT
jgi:hypothetical protein